MKQTLQQEFNQEEHLKETFLPSLDPDRDRLFRVFSEYLNLFFSENSVEGISVTEKGNFKSVEMSLGHIFVENLLRKGVVKKLNKHMKILLSLYMMRLE